MSFFHLLSESSSIPLDTILPVTSKVVPSNVRFPSAFKSSVPVAVTNLLSTPLDIKSDTSTEIVLALVPLKLDPEVKSSPSPAVSALAKPLA